MTQYYIVQFDKSTDSFLFWSKVSLKWKKVRPFFDLHSKYRSCSSIKSISKKLLSNSNTIPSIFYSDRTFLIFRTTTSTIWTGLTFANDSSSRRLERPGPQRRNLPSRRQQRTRTDMRRVSGNFPLRCFTRPNRVHGGGHRKSKCRAIRGVGFLFLIHLLLTQRIYKYGKSIPSIFLVVTLVSF